MKAVDIKGIINRLTQSGLFWVLLLSFTYRNIYHHFMAGINYNFDTTSYTYAAENILFGKIDVFRTPGYPILMKLVQIINETQYFENVIWTQHILSFLSIIPFYVVCHKWFKNIFIASIATLSYSVIPSILHFNYSIFPESVLISFLVLFIFLMARFIENPSTKNIIAISLGLFVLLMIKPVSIIFYPITIMVGCWMLIRNKQYRILRTFCIGIAISVLFVVGYAGLNLHQNNYFGISSVTHDNNFLNVLHSGAYATVSDDTFISAVDTSLNKGHYYTIYCLNNDHDFIQNQAHSFPKFYPESRHISLVKRVPCNTLGYNRDTVSLLIDEAMNSDVYWNYMFDKVSYFSDRTFFRLNGFWYYTFLFIGLVIFVIKWFQDKKVSIYYLFILAAVAGLIVTTVLGGVDDGTWERVLLPVIPFIILLIGSLVKDTILLVNYSVRINKNN